MNYQVQEYKEKYLLRLLKRDYIGYKAKRFKFLYTDANVWIPNSYLGDDGTIKPNANLDWIFDRHPKEVAKYKNAFKGRAESLGKTTKELYDLSKNLKINPNKYYPSYCSYKD